VSLPTRLALTTSRHVSADRRLHARRSAATWDAAYVDRARVSLSALRRDFDAVVVLEESRVRLADTDADIVFHPGMAYQRVKRIRRGETDPLVQVAGLRPGLRVLDATLGFGQDAIVAGACVGPTGHVLGLEASRPLAVFAALGLPSCQLPAEVRADTAARITVRHTEAVSWLTAHEDRFDVILLDPMFRIPKRSQPSFDVLRRFAWTAPLEDRLLRAALARAKTVVAKIGSVEALSELSVSPQLVRRSGAVTWARFRGGEWRWRCDSDGAGL